MLPALVTSHQTVKNWFANVQAWRLQRKLRYLASWEQERAKGKARFVIRTALIYGLIMTAAQDVLGYGFDSDGPLPRFLFNAIFYSLGGIIVGLVGWSSREKGYKDALGEIRVETIAAGATPPDRELT